MIPWEGHRHDPTRPIGEVMKHADLSVLAVEERARALARVSTETQTNGNGILLIFAVTTEILTNGAVKADYDAMQERDKRVKAAWDAGEQVRVHVARAYQFRGGHHRQAVQADRRSPVPR